MAITLYDLGTFPLTGIGQTFVVLDTAKVAGGPKGSGQVLLNNYSNYLLGVYSSVDGPQLDLQPGTANVYDPPARGGTLSVRVKSGNITSSASVLTAQVALDGGQIEGAWPQTLSALALQSNVPVNAGQLQGVPVATQSPKDGQLLVFGDPANPNDWGPAPSTAPGSGQGLLWNGSAWEPANVVQAVAAGTGISVSTSGGTAKVALNSLSYLATLSSNVTVDGGALTELLSITLGTNGLWQVSAAVEWAADTAFAEIYAAVVNESDYGFVIVGYPTNMPFTMALPAVQMPANSIIKLNVLYSASSGNTITVNSVEPNFYSMPSTWLQAIYIGP